MPNASLADLPAQVALALSMASDSTGTDYNYLLNTARSESSFQAEAKAPTSSAQGLFQFIEETWIRTVKDEGEKFGLGRYAARITKTATGRYIVADPADRAAILALRKNPKVSAMMAGAYAKRNAEFVAGEIGRQPTSDELYIAHFLGPSDAVKLITLRDRRPSLSAPDMFPAAAKANRGIFYGNFGPRSVAQVYDLLVAKQQSTGTAATDNGAFFSGRIDFGNWSPTIEKTFDAPAAVKVKARKPQFASADGLSIFDYLAGKGTDKSATADTAPAAPQDAGSWAAEVNPPEHKDIPYITVADDVGDPNQPQGGLLSGFSPSSTEPPAAPEPFAEVTAAADLAPEAPRLKIIHVAKK